MKLLPDQKYCYALFEAARALSDASNRPAILALLCQKAAETMNAKACSVRLLDKKREKLELLMAYGLSDEYLRKGSVLVEKSAVDREVLAGRQVTCINVAKDPRWQYQEEARRESICSVLSVPFSTRGKVIGTVRIYTSAPHEFDEDEIQFVKILTSLAASAFENMMLHESLLRRNKDLATLLEITKQINSTLNLREVLDRIVRSVVQITNAKACSLRLLDEKGETLEPVTSTGLSDEYLKKGAIDIRVSIKEIIEGKSVTIFDVTKDPRIQYPEEAKKEGISSILAVPMKIGEKIIGSIRVYTSTPYEFSEDETQFLEALASCAAIAIQNAKLHRIALANWQELVNELSKKVDFWTPTS